MIRVVIYITLLNLFRLAFCNKREFTYVVNEEADNNTFVGNILVDFGLQDSASKEDLGMQLYEDQTTGLFRVDQHTGKLLVAKRIDREDICPQKNGISFMPMSLPFTSIGAIRPQVDDALCQVEFSAHIPPEYWVNVIVLIKDINDHAPKFQKGSLNPNQLEPAKSPYELHISEGVNVGYQVPLVGATDEDCGENGVQAYTLTGKDFEKSVFSVNFNPPYELNLVVLQKLDFETKSSYTGILTACDGGKPKPLCAKQPLHIFVSDVNDNKPVFQKSIYEVRISENTSIGTVVATIVATDADSREFGKIKYRIGQSYDQNVHRYFEVNEDSGAVRIKYPLQAKLVSRVRIPILGQDGGAIPKTGSTILQIDVDDVNDHAPWIDIKTLISPSAQNVPQLPPTPGQTQLFLEENQPVGTQIGILVTGDRDVGANGDVNCILLGNTSMFQLRHSNSARERKIYSIQSNYRFDVEIMSSPRLTIDIECSDAGTPRMVTSQIVYVDILDVNEYPAHFQNTKASYTVLLPENVPPGTMVVEVEATDRDATALMHFALSEEAQQYFQLGEKTGKIYTTQHLDREKANEIRFAVRVFEDELPEHFQRLSSDQVDSQIANVTVILGDVNDNSPKLEGRRIFQVYENRPAYSDVIGQLAASDPDAGENGTICFILKRVSPNQIGKRNLTFDINPVSGKIYAKVSLDREEISQYTLTVEITDLGRPVPRHITETILISVLDENENLPIWQTPYILDSSASIHEVSNVATDSPNYFDRSGLKCLGFVNISETESIGNPLLTLHASDLDEPHNANLTFTILYLNYFGNNFQFFNRDMLSLLGQPTSLNISEYFVIDQRLWTLSKVYKSSLSEGLHELLLRVSDNGNPPLHADTLMFVYERGRSGVTLNAMLGDLISGWGWNKSIVFIVVGCLLVCCPLIVIFIILLRRRRFRGDTAMIMSPSGRFQHQGELVEKESSLPKVFSVSDGIDRSGTDIEGWDRGQYYHPQYWMTSPMHYTSENNPPSHDLEMSNSMRRAAGGAFLSISRTGEVVVPRPLINPAQEGSERELLQQSHLGLRSSTLSKPGLVYRLHVRGLIRKYL